jgi:hypothetical protein
MSLISQILKQLLEFRCRYHKFRVDDFYISNSYHTYTQKRKGELKSKFIDSLPNSDP